MSEPSKEDKDNFFISKNPFVVESPEKLTYDEIVRLFIEQYTRIDAIKQKKHTFIWGSRGSGKSMMLKYLEPKCQAILKGDMDKFLRENDSFLGVYCPCKEGQINKTEFNLLDEYALKIITEHLLNLIVAENLITCLVKQFPKTFFSEDKRLSFTKKVLKLFDTASIASSIEEANTQTNLEKDPFSWLISLFSSENKKISTFLKNNALCSGGIKYQGSTTGYHDFLLPFINCLNEFDKLKNIPVYLLIDDGGKLTKHQQTIVNTWIANRDQARVCVKVSSVREDYLTLNTREGGIIEEPHDYSEVDVDELYTRSKNDYYKKVKLIAERRLELSKIQTKSILMFLPADKKEEELLEEIKKETAKEWEEKGKPGNQPDYVTRYANPRLFQKIKAAKGQKSYAGFDNLVHISSGIVRSFLEPCFLMLDKCLSRGDQPEAIKLVEVGIQNEVIRKYSQDFVLHQFDDIKKKSPPEKVPQIDKLAVLIESLGRLFYERLHDPESREGRLFSFTITGELSIEITEILQLGLKYSYFQKRTYSTKKGGGREPWYILNRRLCPHYKLDPTGFEGRITLNPAYLELAIKDPDKFVKARLKKIGEEEQMTLYSFEEESK